MRKLTIVLILAVLSGAASAYHSDHDGWPVDGFGPPSGVGAFGYNGCNGGGSISAPASTVCNRCSIEESRKHREKERRELEEFYYQEQLRKEKDYRLWCTERYK